MDFDSFLYLSEHCPKLLAKRLALFSRGDGAIPCRLVSSSGAYLEIEVALAEHPEVGGVLLIPHGFVELVGTNTKERKLGFGGAAQL